MRLQQQHNAFKMTRNGIEAVLPCFDCCTRRFDRYRSMRIEFISNHFIACIGLQVRQKRCTSRILYARMFVVSAEKCFTSAFGVCASMCRKYISYVLCDTVKPSQNDKN